MGLRRRLKAEDICLLKAQAGLPRQLVGYWSGDNQISQIRGHHSTLSASTTFSS
jgi:hypothetical protein